MIRKGAWILFLGSHECIARAIILSWVLKSIHDGWRQEVGIEAGKASKRGFGILRAEEDY